MKKTGRKHTPKQNPLAARTYDIGNTRFIVTSATAAGAYEDAAAKVRRLIRKEVSKSPGKPGN